jgi:ribonuclease T2
MNIKIGLVAAGCFAALQANAEPTCQLNLNRDPYYRLELTVSSTFCKKPANKHDPSCKEFPKAGAIQLHGLWPNYDAQGNPKYPEGVCKSNECPPHRPTYCEYPTPPGLYESDSWKDMQGYMAGLEKCLERHEWVKHGICSPMAAPAYFEWSLAKAKEISEAVAPYVDRDLSRSQFNLLVAYKLPAIDGAVNLECSGANLLSLNVLYKWGGTPQAVIPNKNGQNSFGNCKKSFRIPSK